MENMKKLLTISIVLLLFGGGMQSFAQLSPIFGAKAGVNFANMSLDFGNPDYNIDPKMKLGFHFGGTVELAFTDMLSLESGIMFSTKGFKLDESITEEGLTYSFTAKESLFYMEIPILARATYDLGSLSIHGLLGPSIGIGLIGKVETESSYGGQTNSENEKINWGSSDEDDFKRFDFGLLFGAGVDINKIQIDLSYTLGLSNISAYTDGGISAKNRVLSLSVGYKFGDRF